MILSDALILPISQLGVM